MIKSELESLTKSEQEPILEKREVNAMDEHKKQITVRLSEQDALMFKLLTTQNKESMQDVLEAAVKKYIAKHQKQLLIVE